MGWISVYLFTRRVHIFIQEDSKLNNNPSILAIYHIILAIYSLEMCLTVDTRLALVDSNLCTIHKRIDQMLKSKLKRSDFLASRLKWNDLRQTCFCL